MRKAVLLFLIAALLLGGGYYVWMSARPAPAPSGSVPTLDEALGRPAAYKLFFSRSDPPWHYLCGQPLEQDKSPFEYARSRLKAQNENGQTEDMFCLLASASRGGFEMKEVSIGAPDNPMAGWAEAHPAAQALILGRRQP